MAIACGMTSAITSPLHEEVKQATMAADVLMGTDAHAEAWIRRYADRAAADSRRGWLAAAAAAAQHGWARRRSRERARHTIVFTPSGRRGEVADGASVLDAARSLGVDLDSVCGGRGICGRCQVVPMEGSFPKHGITSAADHLIAFTEPEERYRERDGLAADRRLGCHAKICGDLVIDVPPESQIHRQVVRKEADAHPIEVDPVVRLHYVEVDEPSLETPSGDLQRLFAALERDWALTGLQSNPVVLPGLQQTLRAGAWTATVAVRDGSLITAVFPGFHDVALGVAFDVGSTTVAGHLCDLHTGDVLASAGAMNPQIRFGEDLMSRVSYVMMHPGGEVELTAAVRELPRPAGGRALRAGRRVARRHPRARRRREPDHASPRVRVRPDRARRRAVRARDRRGADRAGARSRRRRRTPARACTRCR